MIPPEEPLPDWALKARLMIEHHWTEKQLDEEISPAMIKRIMVMQKLLQQRSAVEQQQASRQPRVGRRR